MRVFRQTVFMPEPGGVSAPMTVVLRDSDLKTTIEDARMQTLDYAQERGHFVLFDIFEMADGTIEEATVEAVQRCDPERAIRERDICILWWWNLSWFGRMSDHGIVINPAPAPLTADEIETAFEQIATHKDYVKQTVVTTSEDGVEVRLVEGKVVRADV